MYSHFKGNIEEIFEDRIILDVNDIGYEIYMPESEILSLKEEKNNSFANYFFITIIFLYI